jgi:hypothetical protein
LTTKIGRERDNDIVLLDPKVSRYHAQIALEDGHWVLTDLGSANHTYVNGEIASGPIPLQPDDRLGFGELELTLRMPHRPGEETVVPPRRTAGSGAAEEKTAAPPSPSPTPVAAPPSIQQHPAPPVPSRLIWIAGGFILLLALVAVGIFAYALLGGSSGSGPEPTAEAAVITGQDGEPGQPVEGVPVPTDLSLAYEDDFSDSFGGWDDAFDTYTTKQYGNNRYQIEVTATNLVAWGLANRDVADFEIEVEARREDGGESNSYGILFRFQDRDNFYRFDISGDGYFLLSRFNDGQWQTLVDWTAAPSINTDIGVNNILKVSAFGPDITVWSNGQPLASVTDDSLTHGNFGFFASTFGEPYIWVSYDNLKLWVPEGEERAITLIPTPTRPVAVPPSPTPSSTPIPPTATSPAPSAVTEESELVAGDSPLPSPSPSSTPTVTPTSEPTATPVPLPEYASRDQTLGRGEARVTGRIIFPVYDPERSTYDIYMADAADGANRELVQANASQPALSEDGTQLAYRSWQPDRRGLFARPLAGGDDWRFDQFFESARPQFSPLDNSLMYHSRTGGKEPAIYRVINGIGEVMRREGFPVQGEAAKWSPDAQQFVYSSCLGGGKCGIIRSNIDSTNPILLSDHPTDTNPEISPDGSTVVFMSKRGGDWEIYKVGINGGTIEALTADEASDGLPTWSPDGSKIAFVSNRDGEWGMWDMDPDGSNQRRLFTLGGTVDGIVQHDVANSRGWLEENIDWAP